MNNKETIRRIKLNLFDMAVGDIIRAIRGGSLVGAFILSFCLVDYLAGIYRKNTAGYYKKIVHRYLKKYKTGYVWAIRCSLIHVYGTGDAMKEEKLDGFQLQHKNPENHLRVDDIDGKKIYWLNLSNFVYDVIKATFEFFHEIENKPACMITAFIERAKKIILIRNLLTKEIYSKPNFSSIDILIYKNLLVDHQSINS